MSTEENKAVVRRYYEELWNNGDLAFIEECIGPESRDGWRDVITDWRRAFPDIHHVVDRIIAEGDLVAANIRFTGTHRGVFQMGNWGPWAPSGKAVDVKEANFFRLTQGQVVEFWAIWDTTTFAQQLGVDLPQAGTTT